MKRLTFEVNGKDWSQIVDAKTYETTLEPVIAWESTDLGGVTHRVISRWRYVVKFRTHPLIKLGFHNFYSDMKAAGGPGAQGLANFTFFSFQEEKLVSKNMMIDAVSARKLLTQRHIYKDGGVWVDGVEITLREP